MKYILLIILSLSLFIAKSQDYIVKDIKSFGAKGDGTTNDQNAFESASNYFNKRGGNGKLIISPGKYIVGKQNFTGGQKNKPAYNGQDVLRLANIKNFTIEGQVGNIIKYMDGLRFGAFDSSSGKAFNHGNNYFVNFTHAATVGDCIFLINCSGITISGIKMDGNSDHIILGGVYGDVGIQLPHYGIFISDCRNIQINSVYIHHFALDGIAVGNKAGSTPDNISIINSSFVYNGRQGFSWIGGNGIFVKNCKFNHTGKGNISTAPGAGVDIESEISPISNGVFRDCEFIDNNGCGLLALTGDSRNCIFTNCTFLGSTNRAIWISKPNFTFENCNIYGSYLQNADANTFANGTKISYCNFVDTVYNRVPTYGAYLIESWNEKGMSFDNCTFISKTKKLCRFVNPENYTIDEKYKFLNCKFVIGNKNLTDNDFAAEIRGATLKNCHFIFADPAAASKKYYIKGLTEKSNNDLGGNKIIYK